MNATTTVIVSLAAIIAAMVGAGVGAVLLSRWAKHRERREKLEDAVYQAQILALLNGARAPTPRPPASPPLQPGPSVFLVGGQYPTAGVTAADLARAMDAMQERADPMGDLMPPDDGGWEVLR